MFDTNRTDIDPIATILNGVAALAGEDRGHWPGSALSERLVEVVEAQERLAAEATRLVGRWDQQQAWKMDGALSGSGWLTRKTPIGKTKARRLVAAGRMTADHPVLEEAFVAGDVTVDRVEVLSRVAAVNHRKELVAEHVETLIDAAVGLPVDDFSIAANHALSKPGLCWPTTKPPTVVSWNSINGVACIWQRRSMVWWRWMVRWTRLEAPR